MSPLTSEFILFMMAAVLFFSGVSLYIVLKQRQKFKQLIDFAIEGMVISHQGVIIDMNAQAMKILGSHSKEAIIDKPIFHFVAPESIPLLETHFLSSNTEMYECQLKRLDGTTFPALVRGARVSLLGKNVRISAVMDLSELKEAQYALQALNENLEMQVRAHIEKNRQQEMMLFQQSRHAQMGEMISMIAHQWRQPLNVLSLLAQNIAFKYKLQKLDEEIMREFKEDAMRQILQMSKTIDDFRDFFKPDKSKKTFDIKTQLAQTVEMVRPIVAVHGIELFFDAQEGLLMESYPNEFGQSIINILNNAKDVLIESVTKNAKEISIEAKKGDRGAIFICIEDNGGGIDEAAMPHIFDPYFSTKGAKNGTGLGLYMTKMIIEEHMYGSMHVSNTDKGARFEITLQGVN